MSKEKNEKASSTLIPSGAPGLVRARVKPGQTVVLAGRKVVSAGSWVELPREEFESLSHALISADEAHRADEEAQRKATEVERTEDPQFLELRRQRIEQTKAMKEARRMVQQREMETAARAALETLPDGGSNPFAKGPSPFAKGK